MCSRRQRSTATTGARPSPPATPRAKAPSTAPRGSMIGTFGPLCGTLRSCLFAGAMSLTPGADAFGGAHELEWLTKVSHGTRKNIGIVDLDEAGFAMRVDSPTRRIIHPVWTHYSWSLAVYNFDLIKHCAVRVIGICVRCTFLGHRRSEPKRLCERVVDHRRSRAKRPLRRIGLQVWRFAG